MDGAVLYEIVSVMSRVFFSLRGFQLSLERERPKIADYGILRAFLSSVIPYLNPAVAYLRVTLV